MPCPSVPMRVFCVERNPQISYPFTLKSSRHYPGMPLWLAESLLFFTFNLKKEKLYFVKCRLKATNLYSEEKNRHLLFSFFWFPESQRRGCQLVTTAEQKSLYQQSRLKYPSPLHILIVLHRRGQGRMGKEWEREYSTGKMARRKRAKGGWRRRVENCCFSVCVCVGLYTQVYCELRGFQRTRVSPTFFLRCLTFPELVK